jgi:ATP-dependent exoDNAse (exonuclease V) beta subunit
LQVSRVPSSTSSRLNAADIGSAHHRFLQLFSLAHAGSAASLSQEVDRLRNETMLTPEQAQALDIAGLAHFWASDLGCRIRLKPELVHRELPFTTRFDADELRAILGRDLWRSRVDPGRDSRGGPFAGTATLRSSTVAKIAGAPDQSGVAAPEDGRTAGPPQQALANRSKSAMSGEFVLVQGVVDLTVIAPDEIWLVDFKTDELRLDDLQSKVKTYAPQLKLYARALSKIYQRPVAESWLCFLAWRHAVSV